MLVIFSSLSGAWQRQKRWRREALSHTAQGFFYNWDPPKNHKYWKKFKYPNWDPPKNHKYGKKFKYPNWDPPKISKYPNWDPPKISKYGKHM